MNVAATVVVNLYAGRDCSIFRNGHYLLWGNPENSLSGRACSSFGSKVNMCCACARGVGSNRLIGCACDVDLTRKNYKN